MDQYQYVFLSLEFKNSTVNAIAKYVLANVIDLSNKTCTIPHPPEEVMPRGYTTFAVTGIGMGPGRADQEVDNKTWYDIYRSQPRPWILKTFDQTKVVCVMPKRMDPNQDSPENAAGKMQTRLTWTIIVASLVAVTQGRQWY